MKKTLLDYICCPHCAGDLACLPLPPKPEGKNNETAEIEEGLLTCAACARWFPIHGLIPELLPDHLRNWQADMKFLDTLEKTLPPDAFKELREKSRRYADEAAGVEDNGAHHKKSEISIKDKVTDPHFFGPGYVAPFNPHNTEYTMHLIARLGMVLPLLGAKQGDVVLDMGVGYAWTSEWLEKMGLVPIGIDICRTYLDIGVKRMNKKPPHLLVGDIENLPIKKQCLSAVLCYDAFHHIPDRKKAIGNFFQALKDNGRIVLAEPGGTHELAKGAREVMDKYGILEKGIELDELVQYCECLKVLPPEQHYFLKVNRTEENKTLSREFIDSHTNIDCNVFVVNKSLSQQAAAGTSKFKSKVKRKMKLLLKRVFLKVMH
ncbi:MAG: methyltransferase domain-containing protein [bacterium]|nr:methyltransferase domain-containing protein [bacterium]